MFFLFFNLWGVKSYEFQTRNILSQLLIDCEELVMQNIGILDKGFTMYLKQVLKRGMMFRALELVSLKFGKKFFANFVSAMLIF